MPLLRLPFVLLLLGAVAIGACRKFPELELSEAEFDSKTPYPELVPLDVLLEEPEPSITDEVQDELTSRRDNLQATPEAAAEDDPALLDRLDALRAKRDEKLTGDPIIDDELRKRMTTGVIVPGAPE